MGLPGGARLGSGRCSGLASSALGITGKPRCAGDQRPNPRPVPNGATFSYLFGGRGAGRQRGGGPGRQAISPHGASFLGPCSAGTWVPSALWSPPAPRHRGERALTCPAPPRPQARPLGEAPSSQPPSARSLPPLPLDSAARLRGDLLQTEPSARPPAPGPQRSCAPPEPPAGRQGSRPHCPGAARARLLPAVAAPGGEPVHVFRGGQRKLQRQPQESASSASARFCP